MDSCQLDALGKLANDRYAVVLAQAWQCLASLLAMYLMPSGLSAR